ncbi:Phosphoglycolate phosphatase [Roseivivax jejudonensis]|uniref:phosphoglycolate phosphatase n=1 Tax=Roseivivax jejudonensis TaxID=1529041 RepID=A0A1X6YE05_9RHOB|nr:Phosphoglycolate phosphatase [Roseivivax jejudonensis]
MSFIGSGAPVFVARMRAARALPEDDQQRLLRAFLDRYETAHALTEPYPDVVRTLTALRSDGHRLGICTNKPERPARHVLDHLGLSALFETVVGGDTLSVRKPDPAPLHAAAEALGAGPLLYVGDSETDAETAAAADVRFLLFTEGYRRSAVETIAHAARFDRFGDLPGLIAGALDGAALAAPRPPA